MPPGRMHAFGDVSYPTSSKETNVRGVADLQGCLRELKGVQLELRRRRSDFTANEARTLVQCERHVAAAREHLKHLQQTQRLTPNAYRVRAYLGQEPPQPRLPRVLWKSGSSDPETQSLASLGARSVFTSVRAPRAPGLRHRPEVSHVDPSHDHGWGDLSDTSSVVSSEHEDLTRHGDFESDASSVMSMDDLTHLRRD